MIEAFFASPHTFFPKPTVSPVNSQPATIKLKLRTKINNAYISCREVRILYSSREISQSTMPNLESVLTFKYATGEE